MDGFTTQVPDAVSHCSIESLTRDNADMGNYVGFTTQERDAVSHFGIESHTRQNADIDVFTTQEPDAVSQCSIKAPRVTMQTWVSLLVSRHRHTHDAVSHYSKPHIWIVLLVFKAQALDVVNNCQ